MKKLFAFMAFLGLAACGNNDDSLDKKMEEKNGSLSSNYKNTESERARILKEAEGLQFFSTDLTTILFDKMEHDFGSVKPESISSTEFEVTNTGNFPLIIEDVTASCGCTTPQKPENPIAPGESDYIKVEFKPKATQLGPQNKTVTVRSNTRDGITILKVKAMVEE